MKLKDLLESQETSLVGMKINGMKLPVVGKWEGDFTCTNLDLTSLEGAPTEVSGVFSCYNNHLTSLKGAPTTVGGDFICSYNKLTSLEGAPTSVGGYFICSYNQLTSLEGAPTSVGDFFNCSNNQLTALEGAPTSIGGRFYCSTNKLTSLKDVHKQIKKIEGPFHLDQNPIKSHVLGLLLIDGLTEIDGDKEQPWVDILNSAIKYFDDKRKRVMWAQAELVKQLGDKGKALAQL